MSELTQCNHCSLIGIRRRAKQSGKKVTLLTDARWGMGGVNVYVHPKDVNVRLLDGGDREREGGAVNVHVDVDILPRYGAVGDRGQTKFDEKRVLVESLLTRDGEHDEAKRTASGCNWQARSGPWPRGKTD
jgi:hypothetical protein